MAKNYTLIIETDKDIIVCMTDDIFKFLQKKRVRVKHLNVLFYAEGDYRGKIKRFGKKAFVDCVRSCDQVSKFGLNLIFDKQLPKST